MKLLNLLWASVNALYLALILLFYLPVPVYLLFFLQKVCTTTNNEIRSNKKETKSKINYAKTDRERERERERER